MHACLCTYACVLACVRLCVRACVLLRVRVRVCMRDVCSIYHTLSLPVALSYRTQMVGSHRPVSSTLRPWDPLSSGRSSHADDTEDPVTIALRKEGIMPLPSASARGDCMWLY